MKKYKVTFNLINIEVDMIKSIIADLKVMDKSAILLTTPLLYSLDIYTDNLYASRMLIDYKNLLNL